MTDNYDHIQRNLLQMLEDGRHIFDAAANALVGGTDPEAIREDLYATDKRINETQQELRRNLVVHGTVHGETALPRMLVLMSLAKDAERIGDYAKNLFEVCKSGTSVLGERATLQELKDRISELLGQAGKIHAAQDEAGAQAFLDQAKDVEGICDARVRHLLKEEGANHAAAALAYRYFKRVTNHAGNIVTALVVPLDELDRFDED